MLSAHVGIDVSAGESSVILGWVSDGASHRC